MNEVILHTQALSKRYGRKVALAPLDLELYAGEILGLLGVNGSGKSTLIKLVAGVLKPSSGKALILGQPQSSLTKLQIAYLPEIDHFYPFWRAEDAYRFLEKFFPMNRERFERLREFLRINPKAQFSTLSKGNRTRMRLAVTLAREARLYLLDEPLSGIDPLTREQLLRALLTEFSPDSAVILATHQIAEAESLFDRVLVLGDGEVLLAGSADDIRAHRAGSIDRIVKDAALAIQEKRL